MTTIAPGASAPAASAGLYARRPAGHPKLSFVRLRTEFPGGIQSRWDVPHDPDACWHQGERLGRALFDEVVQLAARQPAAAADAIVYALTSREWQPGWGIERGFAEALAQLALQALRQEVRHVA